MRNILGRDKAARREKARIKKSKRDGEKFVNTSMSSSMSTKSQGSQADFFHIYQDREFFPYEIDITRDDKESGELGQR